MGEIHEARERRKEMDIVIFGSDIGMEKKFTPAISGSETVSSTGRAIFRMNRDCCFLVGSKLVLEINGIVQLRENINAVFACLVEHAQTPLECHGAGNITVPLAQ